MQGLWQQFVMSLRLHGRNRMALSYSYLFPVIFLLAFWVLYRFERTPLAGHMGELLTVTVLAGACLGLPTALVSERERGVWRRYRLTPAALASLLGSTVLARYVMLLSAGLLQIGLAVLFGMPLPPHPFELFVAFSLVSFAFIGLGLVMTALANNVPAVQALGQCVFLPLLVIGGIAVPLASLPVWAQHVSAFFPGRYAVEAIQACVTGSGLNATQFSLLALTTAALAGCLAGAKMFRWDAQPQRLLTQKGAAWILLALFGWTAVGVFAETRNRILVDAPQSADAGTTTTPGVPTAVPPVAAPPAAAEPSSSVAPIALPQAAPSTSDGATTTPTTPAPAPRVEAPSTAASATPTPPVAAPPAPAPAASTPAPPTPPVAPAADAAAATTGWRSVTRQQMENDIKFDSLPPDSGVVAPLAANEADMDDDTRQQLSVVLVRLQSWPLGRAADPLERVRNYLFMLGVVDVGQLPFEPYLPWYVLERLENEVPPGQLAQILYWIAKHPDEGAEPGVEDITWLRLSMVTEDRMEEVRNRIGMYASKFLGRLIGKIQ